MEDNKRKLYDALSAEYDLGTFEQFSTDIQDADKRKKLYDATINDYDFGDYDSFSSQLGFSPVQESTVPQQGIIPELLGVPYPAPEVDKSQYTFTAEQLGLEDNAYEAMKGQAASPQMPEGSATLPTENRTREELLAERKRLEDAKSEAELRLRTRRGEIASPSGMYQMGMAPVTGNQAAEITDPEMTKLYAAVNSYDNAIRSVDRKLSGEEPGFWEGVADATVRNPGFYTMGLTDMSDARGMLNIAQNGIEGREDELLADAIYSKNAEQQDEDFGFLYRAGNMFGHSVPFMVQAAVTGGFSGSSRAGANLAGRLGKKAAEGTIKKKIINAMGTTIDDVIEAGLIANTAGAGGTWANIAERKAGKINIKDGDYVFENGESWLGALYKGEVSSILELYTEKLGGHLEGKLSLTKGLDKIGASRVSNVLLAAKNSDLYKGASTVMRQFGLNGYLPEVIEEEANLVLNSLLVGDNSLSELYNPKTQLDIFGGMLLTVGTMQAIPGTIATAGYVKNQYQMNRADRRATDVFGEDWEAIKEALDNATNEKVAGVVSENLRDNENQNKALLDYYKRMMIMRGYNIGTVKNETAPDIEEAYTDGYSQEPTGVNAMGTVLEYNQARMDVVRALGLAEDADVDAFLNGRSAEEVALGDADVENAIVNYQMQKARKEGLQERFQQTRAKQYEESDRIVDSNANKANPEMTYSTQLGGQPVYITDGVVALNEDGTIDANNSSESLFVKYPDGRVKPVSLNKFTEVFTEEKTADLKAAKRAEINDRWRAEFDTAEAQSIEQEKRDSGVVFNMTDAQGEHRIEILNEGEQMSDILIDGKQEQIPTEELNRWKQEAGIQSTDAVVDNTTDNVAPTGDNVAPVAPVELPDVPDFFRLNGKNYEVASRNDDGSVDVMIDGKRETLPAGTDYSTSMPTDKKGEVQYEQMPVERTHEHFVQKVTDDESRALMIEGRRKKAEAERKKFDKKPDPGLDPDKWAEVNRKWEEDKKAAQAKVDYWNKVAKREAEITRSETREAVENIKPDVVKETAEEFIASHLPKITPESFKRETGLSNEEQSKLVGVISNEGVTIEQAAESIMENYDSELKALGFTGDMQDVRNVIIDVLSQGNPRSYAKNSREAREAENIEQQRAEAEAWAMGTFNMTLEELYVYEETLLPRLTREFEGFDYNEYYDNLAENYENDTTRESESIGRGGEVLQGEQSVPASGAPAVGVRNEGGAVSNDVQGGGQNGVAQEEAVNEPVGNSEQLSSSEIPNNQSVAEGDAPGQSGVLLSDEVDENGRQFVLNSKGEIAFGEILEDSGLTPAPILLSEGLITNPATNDGYGLVHIEARHGDQIRNAGYSSVVEFVEEVAKNYEVIREGKDRNGQQTYMLQLTDKHNNTLMVELSGDGTYWNINTAGIFKTSYGKNRKEVYNRHTTAKQPTETVEASQDAEQSGTQATSSMNAPTTSSAAKIVENFENPTVESKNLIRSGSGPLTDREVVMESDVYSKVLGKPRYYGQKQRNYVARLRAKMAQKATELAEKLNTPIEVRETAEGLTGKKAKAKGWYDVKSGNIVVVVSNHGSIEDIQATVLHEVVAHKGLRQMFGEYFDVFLDNVYNNVDAEIRAEIDALTEKYGNTREATEEYLASLAENTYFEKVNPSLWSRIKQWFLNMLTEAGIKLDFELSDNELRYILWRSHQRLVNPGIYNPVTRITDVAVRARLGIGEYAPAIEEMSLTAEEDAAEYANENQDIFVSNAQRAVEGIQQNKATAEQWIAMLKKNGGLKAGEDAWLGLEEWLNEKQGAVTKQEILDFIGENKIQIEEVSYTQFGYGLMDEATRKLEAELKEIGWDAMVEKYPGFDELFEVYNGELLWSEERASVGEYEDFIIDNKIVDLDSQSNAINETREKYTTEGLERKREIALTVPTIEPYNASDEIHFGDAGNGRAVAWVRFGETTDSEGNRVLVIDEIQSKRHQEGREKGYGRATSEDVKSALEAVNAAQSEFDEYNAEMAKKYGSEYDWNIDATDAEIDKWQELYDKVAQLGQVYEDVAESNRKGIPSAPFEKNWHELAMKRMLRLAAEEGFDKVAWTTGEQQAQRYNLSNSVSRIDVELDGRKTPKNTNLYDVYTYDTQGDVIDAASGPMNEERLSEVFGKEIAISIAKGVQNSANGKTSISGDGLRIGGEGMKGFYDKMLPSFVQKYTKKWGAKVGEVTMPNLSENNTMHSVDVTPEMQESVMQGQTMFRFIGERGAANLDRAEGVINEFNKAHKGATKKVVVSKGKETLEQQMGDAGFTDFSIEVALKNYEGEENPTDGAYYVSSDGIVIYDTENLDITLWHENTHRAIRKIFDGDLSELQRVYNELPDGVKEDIANKLKAKSYSEEDFPEESVCYFVEEMYKNGLLDNKYNLVHIVEQTDPRMKDFANFAQKLINYINNGRKEFAREGEEFTEEFHIKQQLPERNSGSDKNGEGIDEAAGGEEETRFRTVEEATEGSIDDIQAQPLTLMERITNSLLEVSAKNKENLGLRADALKAFGKDINRVLSAMKVQREYDKFTVDTLVKLAKMYFKNAQLLGEVTPYEVARIMGVLNRSVGKRDVSSEATKLMDILLDAHTNALAGILEKAEKVKAKKVNAAGVEVMGRLDKYGQISVDEYRTGKEMTPEKLEEAIFDSDNRLAELEQRVREALGLPEGDVDQAARDYTGDNDVVDVYLDERARLEGLMLARDYKESVQHNLDEIKDLKQEFKKAEQDYRLGNIDSDSLKEFRKSASEAILQSKAELIEGYHDLIYKFQEGVKKSSQRANAFVQAQINRAREIQHNANSDMEGIEADSQGKHPERFNNSVTRTLMSPMPTLQGMLKKFGEKNVEGKGYLYERFMPQATKASDNEFRGKVAARVMIETKLKEIYGGDMDLGKFMKSLREPGITVTYREGNKMKEFELTQGQMLYIYMVNKMSDGQMKLRRMGITDDVVVELMTKLPEDTIRFADWVQDELLKDLRGKYNAVHERVFGAPMAAIENYFPIKIRKEARGEKGDVSEIGQEGKPSTITGSIIKRTKNAIAIDLSADAMQVLMEHIDDMEHWAAFAEFNRDINTLLNYRHFQNQVKNMTSLRYGSGEEMWKNFQKTAKIVSGTYKSSDVDKAVLNIVKGLTRAKINFRGYTAIKQFLSAPAFWTDAGVKELSYCYVNPKGCWKWAKENLPGFAERWQGRTMGNEKLLKSDSDWEVWRNEFVEAATRWGMTLNAAIDALVVAQGARAVYMTKLKQFKKAGYTEKRANEKALQAAAEAYNESQQSSEGMYLSPLQVEGTALAAVFTTFKNSNFGYSRKVAQSVANVRRKMRGGYKEEAIAFMTKQMVRDGLSEDNAKKMAEKVYKKSWYKDVANVAMFGFALPALWTWGGYAIYMILGDDDEEKERMKEEIALRGALGFLDGIPLGESVISAINAVKEGDAKYFRLPELIAVGDIRNLAQVLNGDAVRGANDVINIVTAMGVGVSPQILTDFLVAISEIKDFSLEEFGMFTARVMSAPQSNLDALMVDDAMENSAYNLADIAERYIQFKTKRNAPITQFFYSDETEQKVIERYAGRFASMLEDNFENVVDDNKAYDLFYDSASPEVKEVLASYRKKFLAGDKADDFQKKSIKRLVLDLLESKSTEYSVYWNMTNPEDEETAFLIESELNRLEPIKKGEKDADNLSEYKELFKKELNLYKKLDKALRDVNKYKRKMQKSPDTRERRMAKIREERAEAIELINNYRNNE